MRAFLLLCLPLFSIAQYEVLDGIYVREVPIQEKYGKEGTIIGGELMMFSPDPKKLNKIEVSGFKYIDPSRSSTIGFLDRNPGMKALNSLLFQQNDSNLIGIVNNGEVLCKEWGMTQHTASRFYIKQHEVTNAEYREFIYYVFDSLSLSILAEEESEKYYVNEGEENQRLNWDNYSRSVYDNEDYVEALSNIYNFDVNDEGKYIKQGWDTRRFNYEYWDKDSVREVINVYPDTLKWTEHLHNEIAEPMMQMYFWHPVYDNYPVVGLSYQQIQAYLHWRMAQGFKELDKKGIEYEIGLPKHSEWEFTTSFSYGCGNSKEKQHDCHEQLLDQDLNFDLVLKHHPKYQPHAQNDDDLRFYDNQEKGILNQIQNPYFSNYASSYADGTLFTCDATKEANQFKGYHSINGQVFHMASNVSEWLDDSYSDYKDFITLRAKTLSLSAYPEVAAYGQKTLNQLKSFSSKNKLIIGSNWMDERPEMHFNIPLKGLYAKAFSGMDSTYSTVGFRYVIRLKQDSLRNYTSPTSPIQNLNIFEELKKAGFELKTDTSGKRLQDFRVLKFKKSEKVSAHGVLDGVYIKSTQPVSDESTQKLLKQFNPDLLKAIENSGEKTVSFYSVLPEQPLNIKFEYRIRCIQSHEVELILW